MAKNVTLPDLGDFANVPVVGILVSPGDWVEAEEPLIELESDKATMEVPAPFAGEVEEIKVSVGDNVSEGDVILTLKAQETSSSSPSGAALPETGPTGIHSVEAEAATGSQPPSAVNLSATEHILAGPSVRKYARELGVDLAQIPAKGVSGRILKEDVQEFVKKTSAAPGATATSKRAVFPTNVAIDLPAWPEPDYAKFGPIEEGEFTRIQKVSSGNLARNWITIPHVTNFDKSDITETEEYRKSLNANYAGSGVKITLLAFMMKASVGALRAFPRFNVSLTGDKLIRKSYYHIGFAADTPNGLVVPVVRDCDRKGIAEIAAETAALASKARDGKLTAADMSGGCFTVSSLGGIGGTGFTPIINAPEVAILGATKSEIQPVWNGETFEPRLIQPLSLSWDHRAIDGAAAARFLKFLSEGLSDTRLLLL